MNTLRSPIVRTGLALFGAILLIGGPVSGYFLWDIVQRAQATREWPTTDGVLTSAEVEETADARYVPVVSYEYTIDGRDYLGKRLHYSEAPQKWRYRVERALRDFAVGQAVTVYYDPSAPGNSVLVPGANFAEIAPLIAPLVMGGLGTVLLLLFAFSWRKPKPRTEDAFFIEG